MGKKIFFKKQVDFKVWIFTNFVIFFFFFGNNNALLEDFDVFAWFHVQENIAKGFCLDIVFNPKSWFHIYWLLNPSLACVLSHFSHVWLFARVWTIAHQVPLSMALSRQEYWSGLPRPPPGYLPDAGIKPPFPASPLLCILYHQATRDAPNLSHLTFVFFVFIYDFFFFPKEAASLSYKTVVLGRKTKH